MENAIKISYSGYGQVGRNKRLLGIIDENQNQNYHPESNGNRHDSSYGYDSFAVNNKRVRHESFKSFPLQQTEQNLCYYKMKDQKAAPYKKEDLKNTPTVSNKKRAVKRCGGDITPAPSPITQPPVVYSIGRRQENDLVIEKSEINLNSYSKPTAKAMDIPDSIIIPRQ